MLNQVCVVGRIKSLDSDNKCIYINVPRSYKNENGEYESDLIPITIVSDNIWENTNQYCKENDIIGAKGRLQVSNNQILSFIAEKITFLSSNKED